MATRKYQCDECFEVHRCEEDAMLCCPPTVTEVYVCAECEEVHSFEEEADLCCSDGDIENHLCMASKEELEAAGQQRLSI